MFKSTMIIVLYLYSYNTHCQNYDVKWFKQYNNTNMDNISIRDIVIDKNGEIYVSGFFKNTICLGFDCNVVDLVAKDRSDIFLVKYRKDGQIIWFRQYSVKRGHDIDVYELTLALDSGNNILLYSNYFDSNYDFDPNESISKVLELNTNAFILKLDENGQILWLKGFKSFYTKMVVDLLGNIYIIERDDRNVSKFDIFGNLVWSKVLNSNIKGNSINLAIDNLQHLIITGRIIKTSGSQNYQEDYFVQRITVLGIEIWTKIFESQYVHPISGMVNSESPKINFDVNNNIYLALNFRTSRTDIDPSDKIVNVDYGSFFLKLTDLGELIFYKKLHSDSNPSTIQIADILVKDNMALLLGLIRGGDVDVDPSEKQFLISTHKESSGFFDREHFLSIFNLDGEFKFIKLFYPANITKIKLLEDDCVLILGSIRGSVNLGTTKVPNYISSPNNFNMLFFSSFQFYNHSNLIKIPVVFHILENENNHADITELDICKQLDKLNRDFQFRNFDRDKVPIRFKDKRGNMQIEFCLATQDPLGYSTNGINRRRTSLSIFDAQAQKFKFYDEGGIDAWNTNHYLNIWIVPNLTGEGCCVGGYAQFPWELKTKPKTDGVVLVSSLMKIHEIEQIGSRSLTHEIGHWLGLYHIWGPGESDKLCIADDGVSDTPPQDFRTNINDCEKAKLGEYIYSCFNSNKGGNMYSNFMDYAHSTCLSVPQMFTIGQVERVYELCFQESGNRYRYNLLDSKGCEASAASLQFGCLIGTNVLIEKNYLPKDLQVGTFYKNYNPTIFKDPIKICADGSTSSYFKIKIFGKVNLSDINFQILANDVLKADALDPSKNAEIDIFGKFVGLPYIVRNDRENNEIEIEIAYMHPKYMDLMNVNFRQCTLRIFKINSINKTENIEIPLQIYRAPVLLVHGLWGTKKAFSKMEKYLRNNGSNIIYSCDYSRNIKDRKQNGAALHFYENKDVVPNNIDLLLLTARKHGFSASKSDVIAHSMGGILSTIYFEEIYTKNSYHFDINKLITINSPLVGTQSANFIKNSLNGKLRSKLNFLSKFTDLGAVQDLRVNSEEISILNENANNHHNIPIFCLVSKTEEFICNFGNCEGDKFLLEYAYFLNRAHYNRHKINSPADLANYMYYGESSDLIVPVPSQHCGSTYFNSPPTNSVHTKGPDTQETLENTLELLRKNPVSDNFELYGFKPFLLPVRNDNVIPDDFKELNQIELNENIDSISICSSEPKGCLFAGDSLQLNVCGTPGIIVHFIIVNDFINDIKYQRVDTAFSYSKIPIPNETLGQMQIVVIGLDSLGNEYLDSINFDVKTVNTLDSIIITPKEINSFKGDFISFDLIGYFNDGIHRNLNYFIQSRNVFADTSKVTVKDQLIIQSVDTGRVKFIINYNGFLDSTTINILPRNILGVASFDSESNEVCLNNSLNFVNTSSNNADSIKWFFEGGTPAITSIENPLVTYNNIGVFGIKLVAYFYGYNDTIAVNNFIHVVNQPSAKIGLIGDSNLCYGDSIILISSDALYYKWNNGMDGKTITIFEPGKYFVQIIDSNGCFSNSDSVNILRRDIEPPKFNCPPNVQLITKPLECFANFAKSSLGSLTQLSDNCPWIKPNTDISTLVISNNALTTYPLGITNVIWTVTDSSGNKNTCKQTVTVNPYTCGTPYQPLTISTTSSTGKVSWKAGFCANEYNARIRPEISTGVYGNWSNWTPTSGPGLTHTFVGLARNKNYNYQLRTKCGNSNSGNANGFFKTKVALQNEELQTRGNESESGENPVQKITLIPNPASTETTLLIQGFETSTKMLYIIDSNGKLILRTKLQAEDNNLMLDLQELGLAKGVYHIRIDNTAAKCTNRLVVE